MTNDQLLTELQTRSLLSPEDAAKLKRNALVSGRSIEDLINEGNVVNDEKVALTKSEVLNVPFQKIDPVKIDQALLDLIPEETVQTYGIAPLSMQGDTLVVGMLNPDDPKAQDALRFLAAQHRVNLGVYLISYKGWRDVLARYSPFKSTIASAIQAIGLKPGEGGAHRIVSLEEDLSKGQSEAPVIKIVAELFRGAVESRASDLHLEPQEKVLRVRFRIDGDLQEVTTAPAELAQAIVSRVKVISSLKIDESRVPQDGRFRAKILDREVDFRVATFPTPLGEKVAIRVLDPTTGLKSFDDLDLEGPNLDKVLRALAKPFGMILLSGPTGSGKTTMLYALLQKLNNEKVNIVSLEDPVEYFVAGVNQSQVRPEIGYDFASGLRQILRQDPDVIMVGEMRDDETAGLAVQSALTGHIVLSTLHANNVAGVIPRLLDMKVEPYLLPSSLSLMISQRLLGAVCPFCKEAVPVPAEVQPTVERALATVPDELKKDFTAPYQSYRGKGCAKCKNKGILGRFAIREVMEMTSELETITIGTPTLQKIQAEARRQGMITLRQDAVIRALQGKVTLEEALGGTEDDMI